MVRKGTTTGILALLLLLAVMPFVSAAGPTLTPTCTFVGNTPAANGFVEENETITVTARANYNLTNATSLIFLGTNFTRGYALVNLSGTNQTTMTASFANVPDGTYNIGAEFSFGNDSGNTYGTMSTIACTNRSFNLETSEGGLSPLVPVVIEEERQAEASSIVLIIAIAGLAIYLIMRKK